MKSLTFAAIAFLASSSASARDIHERNIRIVCADHTAADSAIPNSSTSTDEISIEVKKINWNNDKTKPPSWGSVSTIKVRTGKTEHDANIIVNSRDKIAFSFSIARKTNIESISLYLYELRVSSLEIKKTEILLFEQTRSSSASKVIKCREK